jgi:uncharacterized protein (TIGR03086 family)
MRESEFFIQADQLFNDYVALIGEHWNTHVPSTPEWTVTQLVGHVADNNYALVSALSGEEEVRSDSSDPEATWADSAERAEALAATITDSSEEVVFNGTTGSTSDTISLQVADRLLHSWDLANAIGANTNLDESLVRFVYDFVSPQAENARAAGLFGAEVAVGPDATLQQKLLGVTGRDGGYEHHEPVDEGEKAEEIHRS